jgi:hypothetical protein
MHVAVVCGIVCTYGGWWVMVAAPLVEGTSDHHHLALQFKLESQ